MLPVNSDIVITKDHANSDIALVKREPSQKHKQSYREALIECLEVWRGRYLTIMSNNKIALHHDLTGGLDSRCLFSFMVNHLVMAKDANHNGRLRVNSNPKHTEDFKIAKRLVSLFDLSVNAKINDDYKAVKVPASESYAVWKYFNIGRYAPIVFPLTDFSPHYMEMGGEGGEDNRDFYLNQSNSKYATLPEFIEKRYKRFLSTEERYEDWISQIEQACFELESDSQIDISILHYREFRSTCHTIKNPKSRFKLAPLGSKYFDRLSQLSDEAALQSGQVLYDIIHNNCAELLYIPFDKPEKAMTDTNIKNLSDVMVNTSTEPGGIYWSNDEAVSDLFYELPIEPISDQTTSPLQILHDKALSSLHSNHDLIEYYFGKPYIDFFQEKFDTTDFKNSGQHLHAKGSFLHALILIEFLSDFKE